MADTEQRNGKGFEIPSVAVALRFNEVGGAGEIPVPSCSCEIKSGCRVCFPREDNGMTEIF